MDLGGSNDDNFGFDFIEAGEGKTDGHPTPFFYDTDRDLSLVQYGVVCDTDGYYWVVEDTILPRDDIFTMEPMEERKWFLSRIFLGPFGQEEAMNTKEALLGIWRAATNQQLKDLFNLED